MDWQDLRHEFPVTKRYAYLDHATVAPIPTCTADAIRGFIAETENNGYVNGDLWDRRAADVRKLAAQLIGADGDEIAFVKNTTEGICHVANGLRWQEGDNVVITNVEFPTNVYPWMNLEARGVQVRRVEEVEGRIPFEDIEAAVDGRTRVVSLSFVQFLSGFRCDVERIGKLCADRGALFCLDAIQGLGALDLNVKAAGVHFLSSDGHKWLLAPEGTGIFFCDRSVWDQIDVSEAGWMGVVDRSDYTDYNFTFQPNAARFECGSLNTTCIYGLGSSLALLLSVGVGNIERHILGLTEYLCDGLEGRDCTIVSPRGRGETSGIVTFIPSGGNAAGVHRSLTADGVICSLRNGAIRVSPHFYNNAADINLLLTAI